MVQLYGVKKQLLDRGAVMQTAEFVPLVLIQVSTEPRKCLNSLWMLYLLAMPEVGQFEACKENSPVVIS